MTQTGKKDRKQIVLRLSPELYDALAHWAEDEFRSINGQSGAGKETERMNSFIIERMVQYDDRYH